MNTEFNIVWFEDNDEWYEAIKEEIETYINNLCFAPNIIRYKSIYDDELEDILSKKSFDLVFADLNLDQTNKGDSGDNAIQKIREKNILADALFYSTDGIEKIKSVMKTDILEGVYLCARDEMLFPSKAKKLIDKTVRRSEDIVNIRGLLMDNVSEFDEKMKETIRKSLSICSAEEVLIFDEYAFKKVKDQIATNKKRAEDMQNNFILTALDNSFLIDSFKLSQIVNKIFSVKYPDVAKMKGFHERYSELILNERNRLAHAKKEPESNGIFYFQDNSGNKTEYTSSKCREIRKHINEYRQLLDTVIDDVK